MNYNKKQWEEIQEQIERVYNEPRPSRDWSATWVEDYINAVREQDSRFTPEYAEFEQEEKTPEQEQKEQEEFDTLYKAEIKEALANYERRQRNKRLGRKESIYPFEY
jgi:hypothetical protein